MSPSEKFSGVIPAVVTPFSHNADSIDVKGYEALLAYLIESGVHGLVSVGTTGESPTLTHEEHRKAVDICVQVAGGRVPVIAGSGSNNTQEAIDLSRFSQKAGADAVLLITPYYNKPNQEGLYQHFCAVAQSIDIPVILYNIPGRCVIDILPETIARLRERCPNVIGIKDATADMARMTRQRALLGTAFLQLSGDDLSTLGFMAHGGHGMISVTANVAPQQCLAFYHACRAGDFVTARGWHDRLAPLHESLFLEPNPSGVKYALSCVGVLCNTVRLPLVPVMPQTQEKIRSALEIAGVSGVLV